MDYPALPSDKGQFTLPVALRRKYDISPETPIKIIDDGDGQIILKVMHMIPQKNITSYENDEEIGLTFSQGVSPDALIDALNEIDG